MATTEMSIIYAACVAGAIGLILLLPNRKNRWGLAGGVLAAGAFGAALLTVGRETVTNEAAAGTSAGGPGFFFYVLAFIACIGAVRLITHPRPVYAALYFILVVLATSGLFLMLIAEFMAFALIIVYAGAILVTYLFVIMLAQEEQRTGDSQSLAEYDTNAREPIAASMVAFTLLASLLGVMFRGTSDASMFAPGPTAISTTSARASDTALASMSSAVEQGLRSAALISLDDRVIASDAAERSSTIRHSDGATSTVAWPEELTAQNVDTIGISLLSEFPGCLEVAAVILMLAMIGAVLMARRPADGLADEDETRQWSAGGSAADRVATFGPSLTRTDPVVGPSASPILSIEAPLGEGYPVSRDGRSFDRRATQPILADRTGELLGVGAESAGSSSSSIRAREGSDQGSALTTAKEARSSSSSC